jgi:DNA polymerase I-like protein with 3'-5' exonuclease and polymerase domains
MPKVLEEIDIGEVEPAELIDAARSRGLCVWDLETTGLNPRRDRIEGVAFYIPPDSSGQDLRAWYPFTKGTMRCYVQPDESPEEQAARLRYERTEARPDLDAWNAIKGDPVIMDLRDPLPQAETMEALRPLFEHSPDVVSIAHNVKFDASFMKYASGCERGYWSPVFEEGHCRLADSMLADFLCDENGFAYGLKKRVRDLFDHDMTTYTDIMKNRRQQVFGFLADELKADALGTYAMSDCYWTWRLFEDRMEKMDQLSPGQMLTDLEPGSVHPNRISPYFKDRTMGTFERIYWGIDMKIAMVLEEMESQGILIDWRWLKKVTAKLQKKKEELLDGIEKQIGWTLNPNSAPQVATLLFAKPPTGLGLPTEGIKQGKSGQYTTGSKDISHLRRVNPIVKEILDWRSADTVINNFSQKLTRLSIDEPNNRIYSHFNQTGTKIYRLSSSNPINLQNQPRDQDLIRKAFCAYLEGQDPDLLLFGCDYSQVELRVAAHLSLDKGMIEVYTGGKPCKKGILEGTACERYKLWECEDKNPDGSKCKHTWTPEQWDPDLLGAPKNCPKCKGEHIGHQARCRHVDLHQRTADDANVPRNPLAKNLNFGNLYRIGAPRFCQYADLYDDKGKPQLAYAEQVIDAWYEAYPAIRPFQEKTERMLKGENNWIAYTITGRARRLQRERWKNEYRAVTQGIQFQVSGSAQDILKIAMLRIWEAKNKLVANSSGATRRMWMKFRQIIQVHDEIMCEGPAQLKDEIIELMTREMENAATLRVPLKTDVKCGRCWDDIH